jgi:hypothetical protein
MLDFERLSAWVGGLEISLSGFGVYTWMVEIRWERFAVVGNGDWCVDWRLLQEGILMILDVQINAVLFLLVTLAWTSLFECKQA